MHELKKQACARDSNVEENVNKLALIEKTINTLNQDLSLLRDKQSSEISFKARAKWYDQGEKSNKYFLNLNIHNIFSTLTEVL